MRLATVVILYHFGERAVANIKTYYDQVDKLYVFDNTETAPLHKDFFANLPKVKYYHDFENKGIAGRLNAAAKMARADGFDWLLMMDQDSSFDKDAIVYYLQCAEEYTCKEKVAMFGARYEENGHPFSEREARPRDAINFITSGSLLNLAVFDAVGNFDENLFLDLVDEEYCVRARVKGYRTIRFENILLHHQIGKEVFRSSIKTLFLVKKRKHVHSPLRCYYMYRNMLYLEEKYRELDPVFSSFLRGHVTAYVKRIIYYGRSTVKTIQYLLAATRDYKQKRMGRIAKEL